MAYVLKRYAQLYTPPHHELVPHASWKHDGKPRQNLDARETRSVEGNLPTSGTHVEVETTQGSRRETA